MMSKEKWEEAKKAWTNIRTQAELDIEQANLFIEAINLHLNNMEYIVKEISNPKEMNDHGK